ncbi:hypothetical protein ACJX0J_001857, partial [Zea mays]
MQKDERNIVFPERKTRGFLSSIFLFGIAALATSMIDTHQYIIEKKEDLEYIQIQYLYKINRLFFSIFDPKEKTNEKRDTFFFFLGIFGKTSSNWIAAIINF